MLASLKRTISKSCRRWLRKRDLCQTSKPNQSYSRTCLKSRCLCIKTAPTSSSNGQSHHLLKESRFRPQVRKICYNFNQFNVSTGDKKTISHELINEYWPHVPWNQQREWNLLGPLQGIQSDLQTAQGPQRDESDKWHLEWYAGQQEAVGSMRSSQDQSDSGKQQAPLRNRNFCYFERHIPCNERSQENSTAKELVLAGVGGKNQRSVLGLTRQHNP